MRPYSVPDTVQNTIMYGRNEADKIMSSLADMPVRMGGDKREQN